MNLTHLDENDKPIMVDVSDKDNTTRVAVASGMIEVSKEAYEAVISNSAKKGPVLQTAVIAAISGAKQTSNLIPMCHPLNLSGINCDVEELNELVKGIYDSLGTKDQKHLVECLEKNNKSITEFKSFKDLIKILSLEERERSSLRNTVFWGPLISHLSYTI